MVTLSGTKSDTQKQREVVGRRTVGLVVTGLTATASGTKATALQLTGSFNVLSVVATNADSALLPTDRQVGDEVIVVNDGAANAQIFGAGNDTIDGVATATGVVLTAAKRCSYYCASISSGIAAWISNMGVKSA
jgi:precorrin-2 methylase